MPKTLLYWDDVSVGIEVTALYKTATTRQLVMWAGASGDFYEVHYDKDFAQENGLPGVIVHGALKNAWLAQLMTDWIGPTGRLTKLAVQYRATDVPNDHLVCKGLVRAKHRQGQNALVDCDIWLENGKGEKTTTGSATVALPMIDGSGF